MLTVNSSMVVALVARDQLVDLLVGRPLLEPALHREREQSERRGHRARVDHAHAAAAELPRLRSRAQPNVPESVDEICSDRIRSYAPSDSYVARKSAGVGCDVVGSSGAVCSRS